MRTLKKFMLSVLSIILITGVFFFSDGFQQESQAKAEEKGIIVKKGDTLNQIAKQYSTSIEWLKEENHLKSNTIYIGQKLIVPDSNHGKVLYVIMAGSFSKKANADNRAAFLNQKGIEAVVVKKVIDTEQYYRIKAGAFSKRENAEKQRKRIQKAGIKDAYIIAAKPLQINGVSIGSTYNHLIDQFGVAVFYEERYNTQALYYVEAGAGVRVKFNMSDGHIDHLQIYPEYLTMSSIPQEKQSVIQAYGYPNEVKTVSCYESSSCEQLLYQFNGNQLIVQIDHDGKTVQYIDLKGSK